MYTLIACSQKVLTYKKRSSVLSLPFDLVFPAQGILRYLATKVACFRPRDAKPHKELTTTLRCSAKLAGPLPFHPGQLFSGHRSSIDTEANKSIFCRVPKCSWWRCRKKRTWKHWRSFKVKARKKRYTLVFFLLSLGAWYCKTFYTRNLQTFVLT